MEHELHQKPVQREKQCFRKRELPCLEAYISGAESCGESCQKTH